MDEKLKKLKKWRKRWRKIRFGGIIVENLENGKI